MTAALALVLLAAQAAASAEAPAATPAAPPERIAFAEAVRRARAQAMISGVAAEEVRRAQALLAEARAPALPLVTGSASYTRIDADRVQSGATRSLLSKEQRNANVSAQVPLLAPSRWASWAASSEGVSVARASEEDVLRTAALTAARAYLAVLAQRRVVEVSRSARDLARARHDFAGARLRGGVGNALDALRAEQQLATSEAQLQGGEVALARAQEALGVVTGTDAPLDAADEPALAPPATAPSLTLPPEGGGKGGGWESRRPDVRLAQARVAGAELVRKYSWADWLPTLLATGQAFANDPATVTSPRTGWQVQFLLSLPIFEGGLRVGQLREREALEREARIQLDAALRQVHSDVRLATATVVRQEAALAAARVASDRARRAFELASEAYRAGATTELDVTTAQQQSRDADLAAAIAEDAVRQARLDLLAAVGQFP